MGMPYYTKKCENTSCANYLYVTDSADYCSSACKNDAQFRAQLSRIAASCNINAHAKGFYEEPRTFGDECALMHTEISEMFEAFRKGNPDSTKILGFSQIEEERADQFIRLVETAFQRHERLGEAILAKMSYNATRPHKHGKVL